MCAVLTGALCVQAVAAAHQAGAARRRLWPRQGEAAGEQEAERTQGRPQGVREGHTASV